MDPATPTYAAFISYRHVAPDRRWARWLHRSLETYRVPKALRRAQGLPRRVGTVFRDEEELPAASELRREVDVALQCSRFLIVVCSPRTVGSQWVNQEILRFRELGRHDRILALLIEGDPQSSFPPAFREIRPGDDGKVTPETEKRLGAEPLAADVRPDPEYSTAHRKRTARLKILAALLGVGFDVLRRRDHERRVRWLSLTIASLVVATVAFAGLAVFAIIQRNAAEERRVLAETRLADSLIREGDAHVVSNRAARAWPLYFEAWDRLEELGLAALSAEVALWQAEQVAAAPTHVLAGHEGSVTSVAISGDGRTALAGSDGLIQVFDLVSWRETGRLLGHEGFVNDVVFGPPGSGVALSAGADGTVRVWDLSTGTERITFEKHGVGVRAVSVSPDGKTAASAGADEAVRLWDLESGRERRVLLGHSGSLWDVAFTADGRHLLSAGNDGVIAVWHVQRDEPPRTLLGHEDAVNSIDVAPDGATVISGGTDSTVRLWNFATGEEISSMSGERGELVFDVAFLPAGRFALVADSKGNLNLLDTQQPMTLVRTFSGHVDLAGCVAYSPDIRLAISGGSVGTVLWDLGLDTGHTVVELDHEPRAVVISPDGRLAASGGEEGAVRIWDTADGTLLGHLELSGSPVGALAFGVNAEVVIAGDDEGYLTIRPILGDAEHERFLAHADAITGVMVLADGSGIVSAGLDGKIRLSESGSWKERWVIQAHKDGVTSLALSADGEHVVSGGRDRLVRVWDVISGSEVRSFRGHQSWVNAVAYSPDGRQVISADSDGFVRVWHIRGDGAPHVLGDGLRPETTVGFSPDPRYAFSGGWNLALTLWDIERGTRLRVLTINDYVNGLSISPNGRTLVLATSIGLEFLDLGRPARRRALHDQLLSARRRLNQAPEDAGTVAVLGEWYAHVGMASAAIEHLTLAAAKGVDVSPLSLARAYRRMREPDRALEWFERAQERGEVSDPYLTLCTRALQRAKAAGDSVTRGDE